jgi:hypothetical protein
MTKRPSNSKSSTSKRTTRQSATTTTPARNSPVPRPSAMRRDVSHEMIAKRAYEIYVSGRGGSQVDNWLRAERELKA